MPSQRKLKCCKTTLCVDESLGTNGYIYDYPLCFFSDSHEILYREMKVFQQKLVVILCFLISSTLRLLTSFTLQVTARTCISKAQYLQLHSSDNIKMKLDSDPGL